MASSVADCPFCGIAASRTRDAVVVAESRDWVAFFPREPAALGHTLVIPREHVADFWQLPVEAIPRLMRAAQVVGEAVCSATGADGMNLITSAGVVAEQSVFHLHLHLLPRWAGDGIEIWPDPDPQHDVGQLRDTADAIRRLLADMEA